MFTFRLECRWSTARCGESIGWNLRLSDETLHVGQCLATEDRIYDVVVRSLDLRSSDEDESNCRESSATMFIRSFVDRQRSFDHGDRTECLGDE